MGIFDDLLRRKPTKTLFENNKDKLKGEELAKEIYRRLQEKTSEDIINFQLCEQQCSLTDNKIGGDYFVLPDMDIPINSNGQPLILLAQLNFEELPKLKELPNKGILQIFIDGHDGIYGMDFESYQSSMRYIEEVPDYQSIKQCTVISSCGTIDNEKKQEELVLPMDSSKQFLLVPTLDKQCLSMDDYRFEKFLINECADILPVDEKGRYDLFSDEQAYDWLCDNDVWLDCQIGGYPHFTQSDIRDENVAQQYLLFQLNSCKTIMWGDAGIANFFITDIDLNKKNFNNVLYNWDCG